MVQLWVNLPAKDKMTPPKYQAILNRDIPAVALPKEAGTVGVIAGNYSGHAGPASTFFPLLIWDVWLRAGASAELPAPEGWNTALVVLHGTVQVNGGGPAREGQLVVLDSSGSDLSIEATDDAVMLLLSGQPIHEPVVGRGPFVMNTQEEIAKAIEDFNSGRFGHVAH
jgi:redox-sensitive bicupin YhaK (pirin superfamily)